MNSVTENTFDVNTGEVTGEVVTTAAPGFAFVQPSMEKMSQDLSEETEAMRAQLGDEADFFGSSKPDKKRIVAFGRGGTNKDLFGFMPADQATLNKYRAIAEGPAAVAIEYRETARELATKMMMDEGEYEGSPEVQAASKSIMETLRELHAEDPSRTQFTVDAITNQKLQALANKNEGYLDLRERTSRELDQINARLEANNYTQDIPAPGVPTYARTAGADNLKSANEKRVEDQERKIELLAQIAEDHETALQRERKTILEEAYRLANPAPQRAEGEDSKSFSQREADHIEKMRQIEHMVFKGGIAIDIDEDGYVGEPNAAGKDRMIDLALMVNQFVDMSAYAIGTTTSLLPGAEQAMVDHVRASKQYQDYLRSQKSTKAVSFVEDVRFGEAEWKNSLAYFDDVVGNAIVSLPHTGVAIGVTVATKSPQAAAGAVTYLAGVQQYWESKIDPSFDDFKVDGKDVDPKTREKINEYYATPGNTIKSDEEGDYIIIDGRRVDVEQNNTMRWGYATAIGFAEGVPEAVGAKLLVNAIKQVGSGGGKYALENMFKGALKAYGKGFSAEAPQEAVTEYLTILSDAAIKGEYIDPVEAFARVAESSATGGFSGGGVSSVTVTTQRINQTIKAADKNIDSFFGRLESGHRNLQAMQGYRATLGNIAERLQEVRLPGMEEANKAADQLREAQKSGNATEIELAELNLREKLDEVEVQDEQLKDMVSELSQSDPALAATIIDLAEHALLA
jgi:hypothetical protein